MTSKVENAIGLRIQLATAERHGLINLSHAISGPGVGGELEAVLIHIFSDYLRYLYLVWGDPIAEGQQEFSYRRRDIRIPSGFLNSAKLRADLVIGCARSYISVYGWKDLAAYFPIMLVNNLINYFDSVVAACDHLLMMQMPEEVLQHLGKLGQYAAMFKADIEVLSASAFCSHLDELFQ